MKKAVHVRVQRTRLFGTGDKSTAKEQGPRCRQNGGGDILIQLEACPSLSLPTGDKWRDSRVREGARMIVDPGRIPTGDGDKEGKKATR